MKCIIGILTLYGNRNYGNRLQNYAIQYIAEKYGYKCETLAVKNKLFRDFLRSIRTLAFAMVGDNQAKRRLHFVQFTRKNINTKIVYSKTKAIPESIRNKYSFFITGSDQVWNPEVRPTERDNYFLRFCNREQRIALSPSIAVSNIEQEHIKKYKIGLGGFPYLSCREADGAKLIQTITGRQCLHTIDPTLALTAQEWRFFAEPVNRLPKNYIVLFFLGPLGDIDRQRILDYAKRMKYSVVEPSCKESPFCAINPKQLVYLLDGAQTVFTDSFHLTAFSINLNKKFFVLERRKIANQTGGDIFSRIDSLLKMFGLEKQKMNEQTDLNESVYFDNTNSVLEKERAEFYSYFERCLHQKEVPPYCLPDNSCTDCGTCTQTCPQKYIDMHPADGGFLKQSIDEDLCISCGKCVDTCPVMNPSEVHYRLN